MSIKKILDETESAILKNRQLHGETIMKGVAHLHLVGLGEKSVRLYHTDLGMNSAAVVCHALARNAGWWDEFDKMPQEYRKYFLGTKIALIQSEASETLEGARKGLPDSHLPHRSAEEVELADLCIRILDYAGQRGFDLGGAMVEKLAYNAQRADHAPDARAAKGGKAF